MNLGMFSSIPGIYQLDVTSNGQPKMPPDISRYLLWRRRSPHLRTYSKIIKTDLCFVAWIELFF